MNKKTKIVCTIGPSTWDPAVMQKCIENGMNCARVNGAFADPAELDKVAKLVRDISPEVSLMVDVKGPEVRMNKFAAPKEIKPGDEIVIGNKEPAEIFPANYNDLYKFIKPGQRVVIGDGDVELRVKEVRGEDMICEVVYGELLKPGKAMNLPGCDYATDVLTEKDKENLKHSIQTGWDFVSASFIQDAESARTIKKFIDDNGGAGKMKLIAKIENQDGVDNIDEILEVVDGIMVARGGLGVELGLEKVPMVQKILIEKSNAAGKPVITATQMLESMITNPRPTRAEANDVALAVLAGTDSVMLSGESSAGKYPVEAVKFLSSIAKEIEPQVPPHINKHKAIDVSPTADALTKAAAELCNNLENEIDAVIIVSKTGTTARLLGRHSIKQPIYAFVSNDFYLRTLMLSKGILSASIFEGINHESAEYNRDNAVKTILNLVTEKGVVQKGQKVLFIGKTPIDTMGYFPNLFEIITI